MNILLTDVRSLTLDMPELPVAVRSAPNSFAGMLNHELPTSAEELDQVIDFTEFYEKFPIALETPELASEVAPGTIWHEYLAEHKIGITMDADSLPPARPTLENIILERSGNPLVEPGADLSSDLQAGVILPAGGNPLPQRTQLSDSVEVAASVLPGARVNLDVNETVVASSLRSPLPQVTSTPPRSTPTNARLHGPVSPAIFASELAPIVATSDGSVKQGSITNDVVKNGFPTAELAPPATANTVSAVKPVTEVGQVREAELVSAVVSSVTGESVKARHTVSAVNPVTRPGSIAELAPVLEESAQTASQGIDKKAIDKMMQSNRQATPARTEAVVDKAILATDPKLAVEISSIREPVAIEIRGVENATPVIVNPSLQNNGGQNTHNSQLAPLAVPGQAVAATPAPQVNPLPPQLETMSLTRNADATEWGNGLGDRVNWMINQKHNTATIRLDPPFLGKLDVHIKVADDLTTITIQTQHAPTRDLIESASLRLRDSLQESGYQNVNVDVSHRQDQQQARSHAERQSTAEAQNELSQEQASEHEQREQLSDLNGDGLVDTFA